LTSYSVWKQRADPECSGCWEKVGEFDAHGPKQAIRFAAETIGPESDGVTFAACAESSWAEQKVAIEPQKPKVRFA